MMSKNSSNFFIKLFVVLLVSGFSITVNAQTQGELTSIARKASAKAAYQMMKSISPNTGEGADYELDYNSIIYDSYEKEIECRVTLYWTAKKYVLSFDRNTCMVYGKLYVDLSHGKEKMRSRFIPQQKNAWTEACASSHWADVAAGIAFYVAVNE